VVYPLLEKVGLGGNCKRRVADRKGAQDHKNVHATEISLREMLQKERSAPPCFQWRKASVVSGHCCVLQVLLLQPAL
jgi:hypothetical protein